MMDIVSSILEQEVCVREAGTGDVGRRKGGDAGCWVVRR